MNTKETKKSIIQAGQKAVEELIKVAKEPIVDSDDDISADRLKNAAATKKLAIFDAFEILNRIQEEEKCVGIVKYTDGVNNVNDLVGFTPFSTYEFIIDGKRLYRVLNKFITIKYEYEGNEEAYNPSWA